jgi:periplasmic protein CpxP/Spy
MKLRIVALALSLCTPLVSTSYAQMPKSRQHRLKALAKQLHITRKQAKQLLPILNAEEPQLQAIRNDPSLSRAEKLQRIWAVHDQSDSQIKSVLTPQQYAQLQAYRQQRRAMLMAAVKSQTQGHQGSAARSAEPPGQWEK